jgi:hypothetical protein
MKNGGKFNTGGSAHIAAFEIFAPTEALSVNSYSSLEVGLLVVGAVKFSSPAELAF